MSIVLCKAHDFTAIIDTPPPEYRECMYCVRDERDAANARADAAEARAAMLHTVLRDEQAKHHEAFCGTWGCTIPCRTMADALAALDTAKEEKR